MIQHQTMCHPIKVLCVDDNFLVAEGIRIKLDLEDGVKWVGHLPDANHLETEVQRLEPDVVLLDLDMPGKSALTAMEELSVSHPHVRVIVVSGHVEQELMDHALEAGAWGFLSKGDSSDGIVSAVRQVMRGEYAMTLSSLRDL